MRVLLVSRPDIYARWGGDSVVQDRLSCELRALGTTVIETCDPENAPPIDLVHGFSDMHWELATRAADTARRRGIPFVFSPFHENLALYSAAMDAFTTFAVESERSGAPLEHLRYAVNGLENRTRTPVYPAHHAYRLADAVLTSGAYESRNIKKAFGRYVPTVPLLYGVDKKRPPEHTSFADYAGVDEFGLCVGRIEPRKNQLAVQAALIDEDIPLVYCGIGGSSFHIDLCRRIERRGTTVFLRHVPRALLDMAFSEARFHILPSWFEAPGLVHIESIRAGTPSIAGTYGNIHEYVDRGVTVVDPWNIGQIRNAARKLWSMRGKPRTRLRQLDSWKDYAASVRTVYREAISSQPGRRRARRPCFSTPSVGISVVYHNQASCTQRLLESIEAYTPSKGYRLYLFDNGSEPGVHATMEDLVRKTGAQYSHMRVEKNRGWIEGANRNFSRTAEPFFVCLNNDVVGAPGWIDKLLTPLMEDPSIWQVGPSEFQGSLQGLHSCNALDKEGEPYYTTNPGVPTYIEGWCFAVRTKQIRDEFGYLYDSEHLRSGYYDDADLSFRIREKGGRLHTVSVPGIQHLIQTTSRTHPDPTHFWRNRRYVVKRWKRFLGECNS